PDITVPTVTATSPSTVLIWPCPSPCTPAAFSSWPSAWWPRTACPTKPPPGTSGATIASSFPMPPSRTGSRPPAKKKWDTLHTEYLDEALADSSGYRAIDEVYDKPHCILSVVDTRRYNRLACRVLDHDPTHQDVRVFLQEFKQQLEQRHLDVRG